MCDLFWLSEEQLARIKPFFPLAHGVPRVDDRKVISGIIFVIKKRPALAGCPVGIRASQDPVQQVQTLEQNGYF